MGRKRTVITIEKHRWTVVRSCRPSVVAWCERCGGHVRMVTPDQAAELAGTKPRAIYRRVESGDLHFVETGAGTLLICAGSL
ncbi:MAG: hypothetical protein ND895_14695 [Pyrinomonadaceae bacterium]|nr:hypothetical protein [Pyrinomonadaceae bacterium]